MFSKERLIESLTILKLNALDKDIGVDEKVGICSNWGDMLNDEITYTLVAKFTKGWEHGTGLYSFPVPHNEGYGLWEGENLTMRLSLIDYILKRLEEVDQEYLDSLY